MGKHGDSLQRSASLRAAFDLISTLRKTPKEVFRAQLVERRFRTLEVQLGQALGSQTSSADDVEQRPLVRTFDLEVRPGSSVYCAVDPEIAVRVVELEKDPCLGERRNLCGASG